MKLRLLLVLLLVLSTAAFIPFKRNTLLKILRDNRNELSPVLENPHKFRTQLIYTQIDRDQYNQPHFTTHEYQVDEQRYFYPASVVKMPTAFLALEKLRSSQIVGMHPEITMINGKGRDPQTFVEMDASSQNGKPSLAHYIRKVFTVSNNDAYNRLYEYLGQMGLNESLAKHGYKNFRIIHRLSAPEFGPVDNQYTNPVSFLSGDHLLYFQEEVHSVWGKPPHNLINEIQGNGFINDQGILVEKPFDFGQKNYLPLRAMHDILKSILFPESVPEQQTFNITKDDYQFLYKWMSILPRESTFPSYPDRQIYPDNFVKFWMFGDRSGTIPPTIRIFNKVGVAYGYLTDVAYIVDFEKKVEFIIAGNIFVNENQIFNDGQYEYSEIGLPFFGELGRIIYDYECKRKRKFLPDLAKFKR